jgi:hypothetical protein
MGGPVPWYCDGMIVMIVRFCLLTSSPGLIDLGPLVWVGDELVGSMDVWLATVGFPCMRWLGKLGLLLPSDSRSIF